MRVSTHMIHERGAQSMLRQQAALHQTQQQLGSGQRISRAADDPTGAAAALKGDQALSRIRILESNQAAATASLNLGESALGAAVDLVQSAQELLIAAQSGALKSADRATLADRLDDIAQQLLAVANTRDGSGSYLFGGFADLGPPFAQVAGGATYSGDDGGRELEVAPGRMLAVSAAGSEIFMRVKTGNGVFATGAAAGNAGSGMIDAGSVVDATALTGHAYALNFSVAGAVITYSVTDSTTGTLLSSGNPFTPGQSITVAGMQFSINGAPAAGDSFGLAPAVNRSIFQTLGDAATALRSGGSAGVRASTVNGALAGLGQALDRVLSVQSEFGSRLAEIEAHQRAASGAAIEHERRNGDLRDLDYAAASARLAREQLTLEAAQQTFAKVSRLSLFDYLR
ncbi:MAG: flagellar hook-associated protein FlgL [Burkholderiales bacterium]|nr:flagellar hook-associated protein FlgL [Burkholderiales bacterium]